MKTNVVFLLLVLAAGQTPNAAAQSPDTFTVTGNMTTPRFGSTATLLNSGKVLIAGGFYRSQGCGCFPVGAELYDHDTGTFTATGNIDQDAASYREARRTQ